MAYVQSNGHMHHSPVLKASMTTIYTNNIRCCCAIECWTTIMITWTLYFNRIISHRILVDVGLSHLSQCIGYSYAFERKRFRRCLFCVPCGTIHRPSIGLQSTKYILIYYSGRVCGWRKFCRPKSNRFLLEWSKYWHRCQQTSSFWYSNDLTASVQRWHLRSILSLSLYPRCNVGILPDWVG